MSNHKKNILDLAANLPIEVEDLFSVEHVDSFPDLLEEIGNTLNYAYSKSRLYELVSSDNDEGEAQILLTELSRGLEPISVWLDDNEMIFEAGHLSEYAKGVYSRAATKLSATQVALSELELESDKISEINEGLQGELAKLEVAEKELLRLKSIENQLVERKSYLLQLEEDVKNRELAKIELEVEKLDQELAAADKSRTDLTSKRQELVDKRNKAGEETQALINQAKILGNTKELFEKMNELCIAHNDSLLAGQKEDVIGISLNLDFTTSTSSGYSDESLQGTLNKSKEFLTQAEKQLKELVYAKE